MSADHDTGAKDALSNFSDAVSNAQKVLARDQQRLRDRTLVLTRMRQMLSAMDGQCREITTRIETLDAERAKVEKHRGLHQQEHDAQAAEVDAVQAPRKRMEEETSATVDNTVHIKSHYTDAALTLHRQLLQQLHDDNPATLQKELDQRRAEAAEVKARIAAFEAALTQPTTVSNTLGSPGAEPSAELTLKHAALAKKMQDLEATRGAAKADWEAKVQAATAARAELQTHVEHLTASVDEVDRRCLEAEDQYSSIEDRAAVTVCQNCQQPLCSVVSGEAECGHE